MTTQPMPLEEVIASLQDRLENYQHDDRWMAVFRSAKHHLEVGKRDAERYQKIRKEAQRDYVEIRDQWFESAADLDAAIDCMPELPDTPTEEPQG